MFRRRQDGLEFYLVHPGGPFFARRNAGVWSIPKGELAPDEDPLTVAKREFLEETGQSWERCGGGETFPLGSIRQPGGKVVEAWGFAGDWPEGARFESNTFEMEWPPRSGRRPSFPEADQGGFFAEAEARLRIHPAQAAFLDRVIAQVAGS
jgi:predicted NUDIX family NTP pyrophosphohydrolase